MARKMLFLLIIILMYSGANTFGQQAKEMPWELGIHFDAANIQRVVNPKAVGIWSSYDLGSSPLSIGVYTNYYFSKKIGCQIGFSYYANARAVYHAKQSAPPFTETDYSFHYKAFSIPLGISANFWNIMYATAGFNYYRDVFQTENNRLKKLNGLGAQWELGCRKALVNNKLEVRLGLALQLNNLIELNRSLESVYHSCLRLRLGYKF